MKRTKDQPLLRGSRVLFGGIVLLIGLDAVLTISIAFLMQQMIDAGVVRDGSLVMKLIIVAGIILLSFITVGIGQFLLQNLYMKKLLIDFKSKIVNAFLKKNLKDFQLSNTGSYISIMNNDIKLIEMDYIEGNFKIIKQIFLFVLALVAMNYISYKIFLVTLVCSLLPLLVSLIFGSKTSKMLKKVSGGNSVFTSAIKDMFSGFTVIKSFNIEKEISENILTSNNNLETSKKKYNDVVGFVSTFSEASSFIVVIAAFGFGTYLTIKGEVTAGSVIAIIQLLNYLLSPMSEMSELLNKRKAAKQLVTNIQEKTKDKTDTNKNTVMKETFDHTIHFEDVTFSYDDETNVINNVNFKLEKGKSYALVGLSGSGKSTIIQLLMGYYNSYRGNIFIDDVELREMDTDYWYNLLSIIQQDVFMFDDTLEKNITLFKNQSEEKVHQAVEDAALSTLVEEKGLNYKCGENGSSLSGGEKQRVSIARALIKNTSILLLDEATASLDNSTALEIEKTILGLEDVTRIVVTHKLNAMTLKQYDGILVIKNGEITESGSFEELLQEKGDFYSIFHIAKSNQEEMSKEENVAL